MSFYDHRFEAPIEAYDYGKYFYRVIWLPPKLVDYLPFEEHPRLRIDGEIAEHGFNAAFIPERGRWYFIVPKSVLKGVGLDVGDHVEVSFRVADQDAIDMPDELAAALRSDTAAQTEWDDLTTGRKRGIAHYVGSAKREETRRKRVDTVLAGLRGEGELPGVAPHKRKA